jgi:polysaccharide pyruvyl transferase WcaK-like protein
MDLIFEKMVIILNIAFVGASGYGNIGDETYPIVFRKYIKEHNLVFLNSDIKEDSMEDVDLLVMGGGGILYCNETHHFQYMQWYMDKAMAKNIPICFISCGIQRFNGYTKFLKLWKPYFDYASVITMRSRCGAELIKSATQNKRVYYYPDLCYLFKTDSKIERDPEHVIIIPARSMVATKEGVADKISSWEETRYSILNFGSKIDDKVTLKKIKGFTDVLCNCEVHDHLTPEENYDIIKSANGMLTGRYHGIVFAISSGMPRFSVHYIKEGFKFENEDKFQVVSCAKNHIDVLKDIIKQVE